MPPKLPPWSLHDEGAGHRGRPCRATSGDGSRADVEALSDKNALRYLRITAPALFGPLIVFFVWLWSRLYWLFKACSRPLAAVGEAHSQEAYRSSSGRTGSAPEDETWTTPGPPTS